MTIDQDLLFGQAEKVKQYIKNRQMIINSVGRVLITDNMAGPSHANDHLQFCCRIDLVAIATGIPESIDHKLSQHED